MFRLFVCAVVPLFACQSEMSFPLRTDALPKEWKSDEIAKGVPYRREKGKIHVLAWETYESVGDDKRLSTKQVLALKHFDRATEEGGFRWLLARLEHGEVDKERPWQTAKTSFLPQPGEKLKVNNAAPNGFELYQNLPTDVQISTFLRESFWKPGTLFGFKKVDGKFKSFEYDTKLISGGVDQTLWKSVLGRDVASSLFPELARPAID